MSATGSCSFKWSTVCAVLIPAKLSLILRENNKIYGFDFLLFTNLIIQLAFEF